MLSKSELSQLAVLERELGGRVELEALGLAERALGEGREPADRLDLVAEELEPRRPVLGRAEDIEDVAANRELPPLVDLLDPLVAGLDEQLGDVADINLLPLVEDEALGAKGSIRNGFGECGGRSHDHGRECRTFRRCARLRVSRQGVQGSNPEPDQVGRRGEGGGVAGPARGVVADPAGSHVGGEGGGQVAGAEVVGGDDEGRATGEARLGIEQRSEQVGPDRAGSAQVDRLAGPDRGREDGEALILEREVTKLSEQ